MQYETDGIDMKVLTTSQISETFVPHKILSNYRDLSNSYIRKENWQNIPEQQVWNELCFCILSGNVLYDLAKSVVRVMNEKRLFDPLWINEEKNAEMIIYRELEKPNFEPQKLNGELRKYRYPSKRSQQIVNAAKILYSNNDTLKKKLLSFKSDIEARNFLADNIPGLGIKEASHFLRNIGYSDSLAIIDVHMLSFMKKYALLEIEEKFSLTRKMYLRIESILRNFVNFHGLNLAIFDLAVWHYMRSRSL